MAPQCNLPSTLALTALPDLCRWLAATQSSPLFRSPELLGCLEQDWLVWLELFARNSKVNFHAIRFSKASLLAGLLLCLQDRFIRSRAGRDYCGNSQAGITIDPSA